MPVSYQPLDAARSKTSKTAAAPDDRERRLSFWKAGGGVARRSGCDDYATKPLNPEALRKLSKA